MFIQQDPLMTFEPNSPKCIFAPLATSYTHHTNPISIFIEKIWTPQKVCTKVSQAHTHPHTPTDTHTCLRSFLTDNLKNMNNKSFNEK